MFVFTFVAGLFTFQYAKPHFDPLLRLPPNRARTHTDSPVMSRSSFLSCRRFYHIFFCLCRMCLPFPSSWKILVMPDTSEGKPSEPPFLLRGSISPVPPRCLRSSNRRFTRKARHDVRVHVRRRVVHNPARQTALRPVATVATEQGNCNDRIVEP